MDSVTVNELKKALDEERDKLVGELKSIAKPDPAMKGNWDARFPQFGESRTGSHASADEMADEIEEYETTLEAEHTLESRLLAVNRAMERIKNNSYGTCRTCKKEIPLERLRANPAAEFDMEHSPK